MRLCCKTCGLCRYHCIDPLPACMRNNREMGVFLVCNSKLFIYYIYKYYTYDI